jgi:hypothetical protein
MVFLAAVAGFVIHCSGIYVLALRVPRPLKQYEKEEAAGEQTNRR